MALLIVIKLEFARCEAEYVNLLKLISLSQENRREGDLELNISIHFDQFRTWILISIKHSSKSIEVWSF